MYRVFVILLITLLAGACGVSRDGAAQEASDAVLDDSATSSPDDEPDGEGDSDGDGDGSEGTATTQPAPVPSTFPPATTAPDAEVAATVDYEGESFEVLHGELNRSLENFEGEIELTNAIFNGPVPSGFAADALYHLLLNQILEDELQAAGVDPATVDLEPGRQQLLPDLEGLALLHPDPPAEALRWFESVDYLNSIGRNISYQAALADALAADAPEESRFPCVSHILSETESASLDVRAILDGGADFAETAIEHSGGPSGPSGGALGCRPLETWVPEFAAAIENAEVGEIVGPFESEFGWHVAVIDEVAADGTQLATAAIGSRLGSSEFDIDPRIGVWDPTQQRVLLS